MICSLTEIKDKDIINVKSGENLGYADDICLDTKTAAVTGLVIYGKPRYFGIFGAREKNIIGYEHISFVKLLYCLLQIDDINTISFCEDVLCHLRVPSSGLMTKMYASFKELFHWYYAHCVVLLKILVFCPPLDPTYVQLTILSTNTQKSNVRIA